MPPPLFNVVSFYHAWVQITSNALLLICKRGADANAVFAFTSALFYMYLRLLDLFKLYVKFACVFGKEALIVFVGAIFDCM